MTQINHRDFFGRNIKEGDLVVISQGKEQYVGFKVYEVSHLTPKRVMVYTNKNPILTFVRGTRAVEPRAVIVVNDLLSGEDDTEIPTPD